MMWIVLALGLAFGGQTAHEVQDRGRHLSVSTAFQDARHQRHEVHFSLPAAAVARDRAITSEISVRELNAHVIKQVRAYARTLPEGIELTIREKLGGGLVMNARGSVPQSTLKIVLHNAGVIQERAADEYRAEQGYMAFSEGTYGPDLPRFVVESRESVRPLANALAQGTRSRREFVERALAYVQTIPYSKIKITNDNQSGFRHPLAVIADNAGDCDSKAVLFLALIQARYPELPATLVYVQGHVYVGLALSRPTGWTVKSGQHTYTLMEPVGPAVVPIGQLGPESEGRRIKRMMQVPMS